MEQFVALIVLGLLAVGIFVGIAINVNLYSRGAFGTRYMERTPDLGTVTLSQEATSDEDYYVSLRSTNSGTTLRQLASEHISNRPSSTHDIHLFHAAAERALGRISAAATQVSSVNPVGIT